MSAWHWFLRQEHFRAFEIRIVLVAIAMVVDDQTYRLRELKQRILHITKSLGNLKPDVQCSEYTLRSDKCICPIILSCSSPLRCSPAAIRHYFTWRLDVRGSRPHAEITVTIQVCKFPIFGWICRITPAAVQQGGGEWGCRRIIHGASDGFRVSHLSTQRGKKLRWLRRFNTVQYVPSSVKVSC